MRRLGIIVYIVFLLLFLLPFISVVNQPVLAQTSGKEEIKLEARYPELRGAADSTFEFEVELKYTGTKSRVFDLSAKSPPGFYVSIRPSYETKEIASIRLDPEKTYPETIKVVVSPIFLLFAERLPEPGEYIITVSATAKEAKELTADINLKAIVTEKYGLKAKTGGALEGRLNMRATAGEENPITIVVENTGTAPLNKITFSADRPSGWSVTFKPEEIDTLAPKAKREIEVNIKPARKTIAGDYSLTLRVDSERAYDRLDIRVTVLTPTIWGWVGVGIVIAVIAGLAVIFMRLGRR